MIKRLWVWSGRHTTGDDMLNKTRRTHALLEHQQAAGTHNPATQCVCGTWRTPGVSHTKDDTGPTPSHAVEWCSK